MTEALAKVRDELGTDAIILNTRSSRKSGIFDFSGPSFVEVTAAVDDKTTGGNGGTRKHDESRTTPVTPHEAKLYPPVKNIGYAPSDIKKPSDVKVKQLHERVHIENMLEDIKELKKAIKTLADSALAGDMAGLPPNLANLLSTMQAAGFEDKIAKKITRQLLNELSGNEIADYGLIIGRATDIMQSGMGDVCPVVFAGAKPRIVTFVGPTGTGKTTTIAKLATDFALGMSRNVSVLTIDTKRVDAVGQLKAYCRIIDIPLHIAYSPEDLPGIMPKLMNSDVTLVDTPGVGPLDRQQMIEMVEFLQRLVPQEVHLTMSVTTSFSEMKRINDNFSTLKPNRVLFTKLDETDNYGAMFSYELSTRKPMSYVTFGQNVPGDFSIAEPEKLLRKMLETRVI